MGKIKQYIDKWEKRGYPNGIPDEAPLDLERVGVVPSYRLIVKAIIKNDISLKTIGFSQIKCNSYHELKRVELAKRNKNKQLKLF